ncbi:MAG: hypothetical protein DWQ34_11165 [Planctomycetota bacterium]|nr:MAG: hypothetical protein DWQ34_11165 [Planctomycetota bacterium]
MQINALYFDVEPVKSPRSESGTFLVVWPLDSGDGKWTHNAHPDRTVMDAHAGDVLVNKRTPYRVRAVKVYRSSLCRDETSHPWCQSVRECIDGAGR